MAMMSAKLGIVVQARMSSRRVPGKVLRHVRGSPLLQYVLERLARVERGGMIIVATSLAPEDNAVASFCEQARVPCYRGPLDDVAARFLGLAEVYGLDALVRVSGDSPLIDQHVVDAVIAVFASISPDLATNVFPRTFPRGQSVEVIAVAALRRAHGETADAHDLEHVTPFFYRHPERFAIRNVPADRDYGQRSLAVDTAADLERLDVVLARMSRPHWDYGLDDVLRLYEEAARG